MKTFHLGGAIFSKLVIVLGAVCVLAASRGGAQDYELPFRAEDFDDGDLKVFWGRAKHSASGEVQEWGYDLGAERYNEDKKEWTEFKKGGEDRTKNSDSLIYKKNIYAMRAGTIIACWRNAPENQPKNVYHPKVNEGYVYGGGNGYWIEHDDGTRAEYAHMLPGSGFVKWGQSSLLTQRESLYWRRRLETCVHDPISKRWAIHFKLIVVCERRSLASATLCGSLLRRVTRSAFAQPSFFSRAEMMACAFCSSVCVRSRA
jgi:hypothetical protein